MLGKEYERQDCYDPVRVALQEPHPLLDPVET
jgi:hypothetical protein